MTTTPINRDNRSFGNEIDERIFLKDGLDTKMEGGEDLEKSWNADRTYTRGDWPRQILRSVTIETYSISGNHPGNTARAAVINMNQVGLKGKIKNIKKTKRKRWTFDVSGCQDRIACRDAWRRLDASIW